MGNEEKTPTVDERYLVPALLRGLAILELFGQSGQKYTLSEIAEHLNVNRSSAFRLVYTLEAKGYIRKASDGRSYTLDAKVMDLGFKFLSGLDLIDAVRPVLMQLRDDTSIACHLVVLQDRDIVYVDQFQAQGSFTSRVRIGTRWPAFATVIGQLLLSDLPIEAVKKLYKDVAEWPRYSDLTPNSLEALIERLNRVRGKHSLISWGHFNKSMATCAAPVFRRDDGKMIAVISVSCPIETYSKEDFSHEVREKVEDAAQFLSTRMTKHNVI